jgi:sterol desaturase/sphingolipid hydroxylase (fatty acid hydroxylase superfamily)
MQSSLPAASPSPSTPGELNPQQRRSRPTALVGMVLTFVLIALALALLYPQEGLQTAIENRFGQSYETLYRTLVAEILLNPWFYLVFALVLLLERLIPARPAQSLFARGTRFDLGWTLLKLGAHAAVLPLYVVALRFFYDRHLDFLTIQAAAEWPWLARFALALLFGDLVRYVLVTPQFHRVHHSIEPRHRDRNFGLTFSIWDHLFGTQYRGYDEYLPLQGDRPSRRLTAAAQRTARSRSGATVAGA